MLTLTSGTSKDYNKNINNSYAGVYLNLRVWVNLGTASNFVSLLQIQQAMIYLQHKALMVLIMD